MRPTPSLFPTTVAGRAVTGLAAAAVLSAATAVAPAPAQAATGYNRCPAGKFCLFTGTGGTGAIAYFSHGDGNLGDSSGPQGINNAASSEWNRDPHYIWIVRNDPGYAGYGVGYAPNSKGNLGSGVNNKVSSVCRADSSGSTCND